jgi:hypothetical protein
VPVMNFNASCHFVGIRVVRVIQTAVFSFFSALSFQSTISSNWVIVCSENIY